MRIQFDTERWTGDLANLAPRYKLLLLLMDSLVDPAGVLVWSPTVIDGMLCDRYVDGDIDALGSRVVRMPKNRILLPHYMKVQYGAISRAAYPHRRIWSAIAEHWGSRASISDPEPFVEAWTKMGIDHWLPDIVGERVASRRAPWFLELEERVKLADKVQIPEMWPKDVTNAFEEYMAYRRRKALQSMLASQANIWDWSFEQATSVVNTVERYLETFSNAAIVQSIERTIEANYRVLYEPKEPSNQPANTRP